MLRAVTVRASAISSIVRSRLRSEAALPAVANAGRHAGAEAVSLSLRHVGGELELRVTDNGNGFSDGQPLGAAEPGHLGLASMRERAELMGGALEIETSDRGTRVLVRAPLTGG